MFVHNCTVNDDTIKYLGEAISWKILKSEKLWQEMPNK